MLRQAYAKLELTTTFTTEVHSLSSGEVITDIAQWAAARSLRDLLLVLELKLGMSYRLDLNK